ncbi:hypothetical protein HAX54_023951 [Datura stramonium]|uniref:DUF4283 domain-containing protein n=1 Tax=Datura stramonium TaxID=4076 RepID=A0ABS8S549_DATST|nr:hypothetical protein [Datura stramonium]
MGRRACQPSLKVQLAMKASRTMRQQPKKDTQIDSATRSGAEPSTTSSKQMQVLPEKKDYQLGRLTNIETPMEKGPLRVHNVPGEVAVGLSPKQQTNGTVMGKQSGGKVAPSNSVRKLSWADEADMEQTSRESVWDKFDIGKIANAGFKLDFIEPKTHEESAMCEIELENISFEIAYWENSVVCYVLGAHPPFEAWTLDMEFIRQELYTVSIWVKFRGLTLSIGVPKD